MNACQIVMICALLGTAAGEEPAGPVFREVLTGPAWEIGPEVSYFRYEEPDVLEETGVLFGLTGAYTHYNDSQLFRIEGAFSGGSVDDEVSRNDVPYTIYDNRDYLFGVRLLWGQQFPVDDWDDQLYIGLGYRGLCHDSCQDPNGYDRQSNYVYLPLALKTYYSLADQWQMGFGGEVDLLLIGIQGSDVPGKGWVTNTQWPGFGARGSAELRHQIGGVSVAIAPFVQYWWVDKSSVSDDYYVPRNNTLQYGLDVLFRF
jgi:hypothetical protein